MPWAAVTAGEPTYQELLRRVLARRGGLVPQQPLRLLDAALEVTHGVHLAEVNPDVHERLGDVGDRPVTITVAPSSRAASTV